MMDIKEIREYLPHRYPFLLVDRVTELDIENKTIRAYKNVSVNEPFFNGHFPQHPIMPGVLIIEAMAQAAGILAFKMLNAKPSDGTLYTLWVRTSCASVSLCCRVTNWFWKPTF